jgi:hypothetical protein
MVGAKNFKVPQLIAQTQFVVGLKFAAMAGSADALKVFAAIWNSSLQLSNVPRRHNVVHMAAYYNLLEIHSTGLHLALLAQR